MDSKPDRLIVATLMAPTGESGVQTHFNLVMAAARALGIETEIVNPHRLRGIPRIAIGAIGRALRCIDPEWATTWNMWVAIRIIRRRLHLALDRGAGRNLRTTVYAQDPSSLAAALDAVQGRARVACVIHYNISEAYELVLAGRARENGPMCRWSLRIERETLPRADILLFPSDFMRRQVTTRVPAVESVDRVVIPNFAVLPPGKLKMDVTGDIISIGTLETRKNQMFLIRVLAHLKSLGFTHTLTLVGGGPSIEPWRSLAKDLGVADQVRFTGRIENASLLIASHRVYATAALMENLPLTLVEALASERPILAPPVGGIPEVFTDGVEGFYIDITDVAASAERFRQLLSDASIYDRMSHAAGVTHTTQFASDVLARRWLVSIMGAAPANEVTQTEAKTRVQASAGTLPVVEV